jgi:hypothetical protein
MEKAQYTKEPTFFRIVVLPELSNPRTSKRAS